MAVPGVEPIPPGPEGSQLAWRGRWSRALGRAAPWTRSRTTVEGQAGESLALPGESGVRHSVSSRYSLVLEAPIPRQVYVRAGFGMLLTLLVEIALLRKSGALTTGRSDG